MSVSGSQKFSDDIDVKYLKSIDAEKSSCFYKAKTWLIHQRDLIARPLPQPDGSPTDDQPSSETQLNIYGEPGAVSQGVEIDTPEGGTTGDGSTSIPATREFTSIGANFEQDGVIPGDILEINEDDPQHNFGDNGRYQIVTVTPTKLTINRNWPQGGLTDLDYKVHILKERYLTFPQGVPFLAKLNPTEKTLEKWGIDEKRDAMVELSIGLLEEIGLVPKIGDRFLYSWGQPAHGPDRRVITYELKNLFEADQWGDSGIPLHYIGFATRTTNLTDLTFQPDPFIDLNLAISVKKALDSLGNADMGLNASANLSQPISSASALIEVTASLTSP